MTVGRCVLPRWGLVVVAVLLAGCADAPQPPVQASMANVERTNGSTGRITLSALAIERIGIQTTPVRASADGNVIPYSALIYDENGDTFSYTNPESRVYLRHPVRVKDVVGDYVVLAEGPTAGTAVVTAGASQLLGIELGIGSQ